MNHSREGYALHDAMRKQRDSTPVFIYPSSSGKARREEAINHGVQGLASNAVELFEMVMTVVRSTQ